MNVKLLMTGCALACVATVATGVESNVDRFLDNLASHCGEAYAGRVVANEPGTGPQPLANR